MKRFGFVLLFVLLVLSFRVSAFAETFHVNGNYVFASKSYMSGCIGTYVSMGGGRDSYPERSWAYVNFSQYNYCENKNVAYANGYVENPLPFYFTIGKNLGVTKIQTEIMVSYCIENDTGGSCSTTPVYIDIDMERDKSGAIWKGNSLFRDEYVKIHTTGSNTEAIPTGTIFIGDESYIFSEVFGDYAQIGKSKGTIITKY